MEQMEGIPYEFQTYFIVLFIIRQERKCYIIFRPTRKKIKEKNTI